MAKIVEILEYLKKYPVFDVLKLENKINKKRNYAHLYLHRLKKSGRIFKIEKNKYTLYNDPFLIASRLIWPSYISCWSAIKYHNLSEQVPFDIWVVTPKYRKAVRFRNTNIIFVKVKNICFFGYEKMKYSGFEIFVADPEKAIIDSALLRKISMSEIKEILSNNIKSIRIYKFLQYLIRINNKSLIKRLGFLLDSLGKDYYDKLKRYVDQTYIPFDYSKKPEGKRDAKWRLIINA